MSPAHKETLELRKEKRGPTGRRREGERTPRSREREGRAEGRGRRDGEAEGAGRDGERAVARKGLSAAARKRCEREC